MKRFSFLWLFAVYSLLATAQVPNGFNYQAVARDSDGNLIVNKDIVVTAGIVSGPVPGFLIWEEMHEVRTNDLGYFSIVLCGDDQLRTGGTVDHVEEIPWISGNLSLSLKVNAGDGAVDLGDTPLHAVPYSMVSASLAQNTAANTLEIQANEYTLPGEALFIVRRQDGYPVFGVFEDGVRVFTDTLDTGKGIKGGFAVGGYSTGSKGIGQTYMAVTADSTRIYVNDLPDKGIKGGFAVGGYQTGKGTGPQDYLRVTQDSTRVYVNEKPNKGVKGGFAVGGYQTGSKGENGRFMSLEKENYFIGHNSGIAVTTGVYNSVMGYESGLNITTGNSNAYLGYQSGYSNDVGSGNLFLGYQTGYANTFGNYNTFLGYQSGFANDDGRSNTYLGSFTGYSNAGGNYNTFVGDSTGYHNTYGSNNTFLGTKVGLNNTIGSDNVFIGNNSGYLNKSGWANVFIGLNSGFMNDSSGRNVFIGTASGFSNIGGWDNIYIGTEAGHDNMDGAGNVFLGYGAGLRNEHGVRNIFIGNNAGVNEKGSNKLYITNWHSDSTNSIIWGDMGYGIGDWGNYKLRFNAPVGINIDPVVDLLSIYQTWGAGTISLFGEGGYPDFSAIKLHQGKEDRVHNYKLSHTIFGEFSLSRQNGGEYVPRLIIDSTGHFALNTFPEKQYTVLVMDTAAAYLTIRGEGNDYDFSGIRLESAGQAVKRAYYMTHSKKNTYYLIYEDGGNLSPRIQIDSLGRMGINQWDSLTEVLDVTGNARFRDVGSAASANDLRITADGTLTTSTSDARLKTNMQPIFNSLDKVLRLEGLTFNWKDDLRGTRDAGLVAQDVASIFPEAVFENPNDGYLGINYSRFPALFVEAIKEQQQLIHDQQQLIRGQQHAIDELEKRMKLLEQLVTGEVEGE